MKKIKILCVSRTYPPIVGGMERFSYHLIKNLARLEETEVSAIVNRRGKKFLFAFIPLALLKVLAQVKKYDLIHLSDAVLAPVGDIAKMIHPKIKVVTTIHGLDITYAKKNFIFRSVNLMALQGMDRIIAVSQETKRAALKFEIKKEKITVIPNGIDPKEVYDPKLKRKDLTRLLKKKAEEERGRRLPDNLKEAVIILLLGRLSKRKGGVWFIKNVLPGLNDKAFCLLAGAGEEKERIKKAIKERGVEKRILLLGGVTEEEKRILYNGADIFVQPNIKVRGDMEGFGITLLEAGVCELPVVAARLEGIKDAITNRENGILVEPENAKLFREVINGLVTNPEERKKLGRRAHSYILANFSWEKTAKEYLKEFKAILKNGN